MSLPKVEISIQSGQIGRATNLGNGVPGLLVHMDAAPAAHAFATAKLYASYDDLPDELKAIEALKLYFSLAVGYSVYVMPVPDTVSVTDMVDYQNATAYAKLLVEAGRGEIRFIGVVATMLLAEISTAGIKAQALANYFLDKVNPLRVFLPYSYKTADVIVDLTEMTNDRVGYVVSYAGDEMGLFVAKLASTRVHIHPGKVADGSLPIITALLDGYANPQVYIEDSLSKVEVLHDAGYNVLRTHIGKAGYYFTGQPMACTGDFEKITNCLTIDKAHVIAYETLLDELNNEVMTNEDGTLLAAYVKTVQENVKDAINAAMGNEISGVDCYIDTEQDILTNDMLEVVLKIQPVGHSSYINVKLGLTSTL